jgi:DNA-directed RNA polymerase subunit RPC12/RpoP
MKITKTKDTGLAYSRPTMCLHCHLVVEMFHKPDAGSREGAWECPECGHKYLFTHWKIKKKAGRRDLEKPEAA